MKKIVLFGLAIGIALGAGFLLWPKKSLPKAPVSVEKQLEKYAIENLRERGGVASEIKFERVLAEKGDYKVWLFSFQSEGKRITGAANLPANPERRGTIVMLHGYAEKEEYYAGFGTERVAAELAKAGFVTLAPDFLGYGESDPGSADSFEDRFQTYTTTLDLIASVEASSSSRLGIWGHSNGGQIGLTVLAITGKPYPAAFWNPVTRFFPYNILYYTDTFEDEGKWLRAALADFEKDYDVEKYSFDNYLSDIKAPILLQQGGDDESAPKKWSDEFVEKMTKEATGSAVSYKVYLGADHNMLPRWNEAVTDMVNFYEKKI